jgi:hypothetical protein
MPRGRCRSGGRQRRSLPWAAEGGGLEQAALVGIQVAVVAAGAAVEQADDDARAPAAVGVTTPIELILLHPFRGPSALYPEAGLHI